jgi:ergothioneine biosynthesis protein EgtB
VWSDSPQEPAAPSTYAVRFDELREVEPLRTPVARMGCFQQVTEMNSVTQPRPVEFDSSLDSPLEQYQRVRRYSELLVAPLSPEDMVVQSMPDASPAKWHLGHTTWFFETFLLSPNLPGYLQFRQTFPYLFNSYYEALGPRQPRPQRGLLTRPTISEVMEYRWHVDAHIIALLSAGALSTETAALLRLGLAHEEQHQELLLMDVLHLFSQSPVRPAYNSRWPADQEGRRGEFKRLAGGLVEMGVSSADFAFDNEGPRHRVWLEPFDISDRLVTNGEWVAFIADGGYSRPELWLSDGWTVAQGSRWEGPLYWVHEGDRWQEMTLGGMRSIALDAPVTHISYYEADAYARWAGARLPSEAEWERAASGAMLEQTDEVAWQWTRDAYRPYPGYRQEGGALGEYNGKFMVGQMVLRGGASVTSAGHSRPTYRNFFRPEQRWMFSGLRLARDASAPGGKTDADLISRLPSNASS